MTSESIEIHGEPFKELLTRRLEDVVHARKHRPIPKPGYRYKRDWYDRMNDKGVLNADFFLAELPNIWHKKSKVSAEFRRIIEYVGTLAFQDYVKNLKATRE